MKRSIWLTTIPLVLLVGIFSITPSSASTPNSNTRNPVKAKKVSGPTPALQIGAIARYENQFNIPSALIQSDNGLRALMIQAIGPFNYKTGKYSNPMSLNDWVWNYYSSSYFQSGGSSEILAEVVRLGSPCDYITAYNNVVSYLQSLSVAIGGPLANIGQPESCGAIHHFNPKWPDNYYSDGKPAEGETLADWALHGTMFFWKNYNQSILQSQYQLHPWLWFQPTSFGPLDYASPSIWTSPWFPPPLRDISSLSRNVHDRPCNIIVR